MPDQTTNRKPVAARGGYIEDDELELVIEHSLSIDIHPDPTLHSHNLVVMEGWREHVRARQTQVNSKWTPSEWAAPLANGMWLCWRSKTETEPARVEVNQQPPGYRYR